MRTEMQPSLPKSPTQAPMVSSGSGEESQQGALPSQERAYIGIIVTSHSPHAES